MLSIKAIFSYRGWIALGLVLGVVGIYSSFAVSGTRAQGNSFVFTAHGDHGPYNNSNTLTSLSAVAQTGGAFSLALGDLNYELVGDEQRWCQTVQNIVGADYPFEIVMGNHEDESKLNGYIGTFVEHCPDRMNSQGIYGAEYYFDYPIANPLMRVIMLGAGNDWDWDGSGTLEQDEYFDYGSSTPERQAHMDWLVDKIDSARTTGIKWVVVGMHKNCLTVGIKGCEIGPELMNMLIEKRVDLILHAHDHTYQRSKQLALSQGCSSIVIGNFNPDCVVDEGSDGVYVKNAGSIVIGSGHFGGGGFYDVFAGDLDKGYFAKAMGGNGWFDFLQNDTLHSGVSRGFVKFDVSENQIIIEQVSTTNPLTEFSDVFSIVDSGFTPPPTVTLTPTETPNPNSTLTATATPTETSTPGGGPTLTFVTTDDATIRERNPTGNYGTDPALEVDNSSIKDSLLRFDVSGVGATSITKATLRLFAIDGSPFGGEFVATTDTNWSETSVTWNTAPLGDGDVLGVLGRVDTGNWYELDVTGWVTGDGPLSLRVSSIDDNGADYSTKENADGNAPQLIVHLEEPTQTPTLTETPTEMPTETVTETSTDTPIASATPTETPMPTETPAEMPTATATDTPTASATPTETPSVLTFTPSDDTTIRETSPSSNYGADIRLEVDASSRKDFLLRFDVSGLGGASVTSATLRLYTIDSSSVGGYFYEMTNTSWSESAVTWNTAPPADGALLATLGNVSAGNWYEVDISSLVTGEGPVSLRVISDYDNGADYSAKENANGNAPELILSLSEPVLTSAATLIKTPTPGPTSTHLSTTPPTATDTVSTATPTIAPSNTPTATDVPITTEPPSTQALEPLADAYVYGTNPDTNYGRSTALRTDGSPIMRSYLRFEVPPISGTVTSATLRIFAETSSKLGYDTHVTDSGWSESTITYANAPPLGAIIASSGTISGGAWTAVDVTTWVTGGGQYDFVITSKDTTATRFSSREGINPSELIVVVQSNSLITDTLPATGTPTGTATPTNTLTPTETPTRTPTATFTATATAPSTNTATITNTPTNTATLVPTTEATVTPTALPAVFPAFQPQAPYYASFFYLWYKQPNPDGVWSYWNDHGNNPPQSWFSHYLPDYRADVVDPASELYSSMNYDVFKWQVSRLAEAKQEVAIASWWGRGRKEDIALQTILNTYMSRTDNPYPDLRWCIYYEAEGYGDESVDTLVANLEYIKSELASSPYYLKVEGKPVIFVYAGANDIPGTMTQRWEQANAQMGNYFYVVLKVFPGYEADVNQPDSWHQYAPTVRGGRHGSYSAFVSPGFWLDDGYSSPQLPRDLSEFEAAVITMVNADVTWKLVETWNEWGEGTSVEPGYQVIENSSGEAVLDPNGPEFGNAYVDILNAYLPPLESGKTSAGVASSQMDTTLSANTQSVTPTPTATLIPAASLHLVESDDPIVKQTGEWTAHNTGVASGGTYVFSSGSAQDTLSLFFTGTYLEVVYVQHPALGSFSVNVDGSVPQQVDSSGEQAFGQRMTLEGLAPGPHMVQIVPVDGHTVAVDAFGVEGVATWPMTPAPEPTVEPPVAITPTPTATLTPIPLEPATVTPTPPATSAPQPHLLPVLDSFDSAAGWQVEDAWQWFPEGGYHGAGWHADITQQAASSSTLTTAWAIDLRTAQQPELHFWQKHDLTDKSMLVVELSVDGGLSWLPIDQQGGGLSDWTEHVVNLSAFRGHVVRLRFRLDAQVAVAADEPVTGWWVDELLVQDVLPVPPTETPPPSATATPVPPTATLLPSATATPVPPSDDSG